jgi:hypothetical protein
MVSVPDDLLPEEYRNPDPSKCKVSPEDYPREARRYGLEGAVVLEFSSSASRRIALAQVRYTGVHTLLERASFTVISRCMNDGFTGMPLESGTIDFTWVLE